MFVSTLGPIDDAFAEATALPPSGSRPASG
jgi:hypothetical protein